MDDQKIKKLIGRRIKEAREKLGWSQTELAEKLGKNPSTVSAYEAGTRTIRVTDLPYLAELLRVPIQYFFDSSNILDEMLSLINQLDPTFKRLLLNHAEGLLEDQQSLYDKGMKTSSKRFLVYETDAGQKGYIPIEDDTDQDYIDKMIQEGWYLVED